jgi:nitrite reductase (NADH) small subunit
MNRFVKIADVGEFAGRRSKRVTVEDVDIVLFAAEGQFFAVQNSCPHQHFSNLHEGMLNGREITCPMHGWTFNIESGLATIGGGRLKRYAVKVVGTDILIEAPDTEPDWAKT